MPSLADSQRDFAAAIFDPEQQVPSELRVLNGPVSIDRFAVYRNNVMVGLIEGLRDAYPVVCRLVGDEFFRAMAAIFARANPPRSPVMLEYGDGLAEFIAGFPPLAGLPYLPDVARLERAWVEAYHAAEWDADVGQSLHPAVRLVRSPYPVFAIWQANRQKDRPDPMELTGQGENVLVTRLASQVRACPVPDEDAALIVGFLAGRVPDYGAAAPLARLRSLGALPVQDGSE